MNSWAIQKIVFQTTRNHGDAERPKSLPCFEKDRQLSDRTISLVTHDFNRGRTLPMTEEGPPLEVLTHRLADCPQEFLAPPRIGGSGELHVAALVSDLMEDAVGQPPPRPWIAAFLGAANPAEAQTAVVNRLSCAAIATWLLAEPGLARRLTADSAVAFLVRDITELAQLTAAPKLVSDADRREELARLALASLGLRPAGESETQAKDRLETVSSVVRNRVIRETRAAQERAQAIREAMRKKAAEEAAAKYNRE
jgi:hypothetical protein